MPPTDSVALIVARFLKSNQYIESYDAFINEAGLPLDAGNISSGDMTLETLLEEKKTFDLSVRFEKLGTDDRVASWTQPAPTVSHVVPNLPSSANILNVTTEKAVMEQSTARSLLFASAASRRLHIIDVLTGQLKDSLSDLQDSPILSCSVLNGNILLSTSMSGQLVASHLGGSIIDKRRDHSKYIVKVAVFNNNDEAWIATAGWDSRIVIYKPSGFESFKFNEPIATLSLPSKPEGIILLQHPESSKPILVISRSDSSSLFYYTMESEPRLLGRQNLAPHSNAWVAFTPSSLAICPTDATLVAVGTSTIPHMKLLIARLLIPPYEETLTTQEPQMRIRSSLLDDSPATETQASQARAALAIADRESAAIQIHCNTMAPQTAYSTPAVAWRPDGSGVWVNGDDGSIRGIETSSGKVVSTLNGHEAGSKVRCLWAGSVGIDGGVELLVSGGFDQKLILWKVE